MPPHFPLQPRLAENVEVALGRHFGRVVSPTPGVDLSPCLRDGGPQQRLASPRVPHVAHMTAWLGIRLTVPQPNWWDICYQNLVVDLGDPRLGQKSERLAK
jgi:hypothetical protein